MISLATRTGFAVVRKPEDDRLVHLFKDLPADNQHTIVSRRPFAECVVAA